MSPHEIKVYKETLKHNKEKLKAFINKDFESGSISMEFGECFYKEYLEAYIALKARRGYFYTIKEIGDSFACVVTKTKM